MKALDWLLVSGVSPLLKRCCPVTIHVYLCFSFNQDGIVERIGISYVQFCWYSSTNCDGNNTQLSGKHRLHPGPTQVVFLSKAK